MFIKMLRLTLILLVTVAAWPVAAEAQTPPSPPPRQEGTAEVAFVGTTGNTSTNTFSGGGEHIFRPTNWLIRNRALGIRSEAEGTTTASSFLYGFRAERAINARTSAFGDYAYFRNELSGVSNRNTVTGGLAYKVLNSARQTLTADAGAGYLNEQRVVGEDVSSPIYTGGTLYKLKISETSELSDEFRLLGTFDNGDDWRVAHMIALTARLTTLLSLKVSNTVRYSNFPPPGFKKTDTTTAVALVASFKSK